MIFYLQRKGVLEYQQNYHWKNEHPLFCPVFALDSKLHRSISGLLKWEPCSKAGVYVGQSPEHRNSYALVMNLTTRLVSPQFRLGFDYQFSTISYIDSLKEPSNWKDLVENHTEDYSINNQESDTINNIQNSISIISEEMNQSTESDTIIEPQSSLSFNRKRSDTTVSEGDASDRLQQIIPSYISHIVSSCSSEFLSDDPCIPHCFINMNHPKNSEFIDPFSFQTNNVDNNVLMYHQALQENDWPDFVMVMDKEIMMHEYRKHWKIVPRSKAKQSKIIKALWSFKLK